jgi:two-component system, chemotaxis family, sensor histidine kinase and response regulator WspE
MSGRDLSQLSMQDLFRIEAENQTQVLTTGLLALERDPKAADQLEACMRAAHSLKGAARIIDLAAGVTLTHAMEDFLVAAQTGRITLDQHQIDLLLDGVDLIMAITKEPDLEIGKTAGASRPAIDSFVARLRAMLAGEAPVVPPPAPIAAPSTELTAAPEPQARGPSVQTPPPATAPQPAPETVAERDSTDRALRVTVENLNRLLGLAGETLIESRWLRPFGDSLRRLKFLHLEGAKKLDSLREVLAGEVLSERAETLLKDARAGIGESQKFLASRLEELEVTERHSTRLAHRLYDQALACSMRPFNDGVTAFPRMVRDIGRSLGKAVRLEIVGQTTQIDRDILEKLDAPLGHLLRNAIDHGLETPEERVAAGKAPEGVVRIEARHSVGRLQIVVSDDGRGFDIKKIRETIVNRRLASSDTAEKLSEAELLEFLFLPGFTMSAGVTEISGRGVGLNAVQDMVKRVRGTVRASPQPGGGARFQLQLPLTLSVVRTLFVEIGGEPYAVPFAYIFRAVRVPRDEVETLEGRQYFNLAGERVGLVSAHQILGGAPDFLGSQLSVIVVGEHDNRYGLVVNRFLGARELVVQPLDPRLGKIKDISAAALMEDGSPILIIDVEDLIRSMEKLAHAERVGKVEGEGTQATERSRKRVLVVDDSLIVRELERKLLDHHGYEVEIAVDGMDGWNALRGGAFDLVITDIDMPRMDGIELVGMIKNNPTTKTLPVMVLSYKDRDEDRRRGLDAGADYYLTKGAFHDDTLINAVEDLIGKAAA